MPIRVTCQNCGKKFSAWDDLVGKAVQCPKCHRQMIVPGENDTSAGVPPEEDIFFSETPKAAAPAPPAAKPPPVSGPTPQAPPKQRRTVKLSRPQGSRTKDPAPPPVTPPAGPPIAPVRVPAPEEENAEDLTLPCPKCNAPMPLNEDLCDACGYHRILKKVIDTTDVYKPTAETGFEKMLTGQIADFESPESALFWAKLVAVVLLALVCFTCLGIWGFVLVAVIVAGYFVWAAQVKKNVGAEESVINRDPISIAVWQVLLFLQRAVGWRLPQWPFPKTRVLAMHDPSFSDDDLAELEDLEGIETLDFEGSQITDQGLAHFESLKKLRFLVLRKTGVTPQGAQRLQKMLPKAWIWR